MRRSVIAALAAVVLATVPASAADKPATLEQLLEQTRNARAEQEKINAERERAFLAGKADQGRMLADAIRKRDEAEARSKALSATFDENERRLAEQEDLMNQRMGSLGELFGVVRQVAGDSSNVMYTSLLSAQYPGRDQFFGELGKAKSLPSTEDLERLWFELQREMTESGRVVRFPTTIVEANGQPRQTDVVRIGGFVATAGGRYLNYLPSLGQLAVLARQPSDDLTALAGGVESARDGYVQAAVDPTRGVLLTMIVQRPNIAERIEHGEAVGYVILVVGALGVLVAVYQTLFLIWTRVTVRRQLANLDSPMADNPLGRVLRSVRTTPETIEEDAEVVELRISEAVLREVPRLERFQAFLRLAVAAGPLLGLIGTVIGMIITFQSITESGSSDPRLMANGISQAMIATVLGLGIAIPLLFMNAGLVSMSRGVVQILDEQSAGILAERLERAKAKHRNA